MMKKNNQQKKSVKSDFADIILFCYVKNKINSPIYNNFCKLHTNFN